MSHALNIHDGLGEIAKDPSEGILIAYGRTVPASGVAGYAPGCRFTKTDGTSIGTVSYINIGTKASANFVSVSNGGLVVASYVYGDASAIDGHFFWADRSYIVQSIGMRVTVVGSDAGAVTAQIRKCGAAAAPSAGTLLHSGTLNLKGTVDTTQQLTILTTQATITVNQFNTLALDVTGVTTAARGVISVALLPV